MRQSRANPIVDNLHQWMVLSRHKIPKNTAISKALNYSLKRWVALACYLDGGAIPIDNKQVETVPDPGHWGVKTGYSLARYVVASGQLRSCR